MSENKMVTKSDLQDFYDGIKPFLNGDVSSIYSTDERVVGRWIDGKPIYQKTIDYDSTVSVGTTEKQTELADLTSLGIDTLVDMWGKFFSSGGSQIRVFNSRSPAMTNELFVSNNKLILQSVRVSNTVTLSEIYVTIQYTKITE